MTALTQTKSINAITVYSISVFFVSVAIISFFLFSELSNPLSLTFILGVLALLLVWHFGIKFPYFGLVSMERLIQFHMLLTLPLFDTVLINMCAGFIMPFVNKSYRLGSYKVAILRAFNNAGMNGLMLLIAGLVLRYYDVLPIEALTPHLFILIMSVAVVMQIVNISMIAIYHTVDKKNFKKLLSPAMLYADLFFAPIGVLSALLFQLDNMSYFYLFVLFAVLIMLSFKTMPLASSTSSQLFSAAKYQSNYFDIDSVSQTISRRINDIFTYNALYLGAYNEELQELEMFLQVCENDMTSLSASQLTQISQEVVLKSEVIVINNHKYAKLSSPFINQDGNFAFICMLKKSTNAYSISDSNLLQLFVQRYSMGLSYGINYKKLSEHKNTLESRVTQRTLALEKAHQEKSLLVEELRELAHRDGLTGLYNRRALDEVMLKLEKSSVKTVCFAVLDIDFFKYVNDDFGHEVGDKVLQQLANILNRNHAYGMRIIRYGGEEFVLLLHNIEYKQAVEYCQDLLTQIENYRWGVIAPGLNVTISIGLSHYPEVAIADLFSVADKRLYKAKQNGRNQLVHD